MTTRPTLLNSCARAATTAEARFRIDAAPQTARATRVVALDEGAADAVGPLLRQPWHGARFLRYPGPREHDAPDGEPADIVLADSAGAPVRLSGELADADMVMMIATAADGAPAATAIGDACALRGIMTAGLVLGQDSDAVTALRPHARVLLVTKDRRDIPGLLTALGA